MTVDVRPRQVDSGEVVALAEPTLTVAVVARRLGIAPATLRTWARRYDLGPSEHAAGSHRRYTARDFARLVVMRQMTHEGIPPGEAARIALSTAPDSLSQVGVAEITSLDEARTSETSFMTGFGPTARVVPLQQSRRVARGLGRAALSMDAHGMARLIQRQISTTGVVHTWDDVMVPVLVGLGQRWAETGEGVEVEHLFAEAAISTLHVVTSRLGEPRNTAPVLLCCADEEQHSLPLYATAAALAELGVSSRVLGARLPTDALAAAVRRVGPAVIMVFGSMQVSPAVLEQLLRRTRPTPRLLLGGPGWGHEPLPPYAERVTSLRGAVDRICEFVATSD